MSGRPLAGRENRAGWLFASPALALIVGFFFLPVAGGLLLSLTDFDIYAIGKESADRGTYVSNRRAAEDL